MSADTVYRGVTVEQLQGLLQDEGYKAKITEGSSGKRYLQSAVGGYKFSIYFYGQAATSDPAGSIQLFAGFKVSQSRESLLQKCNEWNSTKRFMKVYVDSEGDLCGDMDFAVEHGVTGRQIVDYISWLGAMLNSLGEVF